MGEIERVVKIMAHRMTAGLLFVALALALVGCNAQVRHEGGRLAQIVSPAEAQKLLPHLRFEWMSDLPILAVRDIYYDRGLLYLEFAYGWLGAFDAAKGTLVWLYPLRSPLDYPPCSNGDKLFFFTSGTMHVVDCNTGQRLVKKNPLLGLITPPVATEKLVISSCTEGKLHGIGQMSCWPEWTRALESLAKSVAFYPPDNLYIITTDAELRSYDVTTGVLHWQKQLAATPLAPPAVGPDGVYVGGQDYFVTAFNHGGDQRWRKVVGGATLEQPVLAHGKLFLIVKPGTAVVLDPASGQELWRQPGPGRFITASKERAYFLDLAGEKLLCCNLSDGAPQGELDARDFLNFCADPEAGRFIAATHDGRLYGLADVAELPPPAAVAPQGAPSAARAASPP